MLLLRFRDCTRMLALRRQHPLWLHAGNPPDAIDVTWVQLSGDVAHAEKGCSTTCKSAPLGREDSPRTCPRAFKHSL